MKFNSLTKQLHKEGIDLVNKTKHKRKGRISLRRGLGVGLGLAGVPNRVITLGISTASGNKARCLHIKREEFL